MKPVLIENDSQMHELAEQLQPEKLENNLIAVDTEFFRETTYYPKLALVQIATDSIVACIDPLAFDARPALKKILLDENLRKVFHSCSQDMEVLYYYLGEAPVNIYDTQLAHALLDEHQQIGYAALVEKELGVQLDKSQTRTNWLQRPLTQKQIDYAGDDVFYLYQLQQTLDRKLDEAGRKAWFEEDSRHVHCSENNFQVDMDRLWKRVKGSNRLNRKKLAVVQAIARWREQQAQQKDLTRRKVMADNIVVDLAFNPPEDIQALQAMLDRRQQLNTQELQTLLDTITQAQQLPAEQWPDNQFSILDDRQKGLLKKLQQQLAEKAGELGLSTGILCSRKDLEQLILQSERDNEEALNTLGICHGWRYECIGRALVDTIHNAK